VIILDSSFLIAFHNGADVHHDPASRLMDRFLDGEFGQGLLLEYVVVEVVTVIAIRLDLARAIEVGDALLESEELDFVPGSDHFLHTLATFRSQKTEGLSFTDVAIVSLARAWGVPEVATFDRGFRGVPGVRVIPD